jgi:hypothetical protein
MSVPPDPAAVAGLTASGVGPVVPGSAERASAEELAGWLLSGRVAVLSPYVAELDAVLAPFVGGADLPG